MNSTVASLRIGSKITYMCNGRKETPKPIVSMTEPKKCGDGSGMFSYVTVDDTFGQTSSVLADRDLGKFWEVSE